MPASHGPPLKAAAALLLPVLLCACGGASKGDAEVVRALVAREAAATNARDLKALEEIWSQNRAILLFDVPPPGRFQGWDKIGHLFKDFFERFSDVHLTVANVQVDVEGGMAYATFDWTMTGKMGEYAVNDRGEATSIYRKEEGGWRLVHAHYSSVPPALADQAEKPEPAPVGASPSPVPSPAASAAPSPGGTPPGR